ncbi:MAG: hypothetical protein PHT84_01310 [Candidatus Pacebacteria bacterium]|nr:hypothetical protein [Candidatus Paceibacterota bacterium]
MKRLVQVVIILKKTKVVDVFNRTSRKIKCIVNEMDYLGDASIWKEEKLVVGELYTLIEASKEAYGSVVYIKEVPSTMGIQASLFEELEEYYEDILKEKAENWLEQKLGEAEQDVADGKVYPAEEVFARLRELIDGMDINQREERNRKRIAPFLEELGLLWEKYPDLRFGQIVAYIENDDTKRFYMEDEELLERIHSFMKRKIYV